MQILESLKKKIMIKLYTMLLLAFATGIYAQVATLDSKKVLASVPELVKLDTLIAKQQKDYQAEFSAKIKAAQIQKEIVEGLSKKNPNDVATKDAASKFEKLAKEAQEYQNDANKKLTDYKDLLYKPYLEKINNAVKTVAERRKFMQVIDIQSVSLVYLNSATDVTDEVIKELKKN